MNVEANTLWWMLYSWVLNLVLGVEIKQWLTKHTRKNTHQKGRCLVVARTQFLARNSKINFSYGTFYMSNVFIISFIAKQTIFIWLDLKKMTLNKVKCSCWCGLLEAYIDFKVHCVEEQLKHSPCYHSREPQSHQGWGSENALPSCTKGAGTRRS